MSDIGSTSAFIAVLVSAALSQSPAPQPRKSTITTIDPYPGSIKHCSEHITGAPQRDGKTGPHINWVGYYSKDPIEKVVAHYTRLLGPENYRKEGERDVWRFPLEKPERVVSVTPAGQPMPGSQCVPVPASAQAVVIISAMTGRE